MAESQVNYMRSFLETYAPNKTPEGVFKALDAISPPHRYKMTPQIEKVKYFFKVQDRFLDGDLLMETNSLKLTLLLMRKLQRKMNLLMQMNYLLLYKNKRIVFDVIDLFRAIGGCLL